MLPKGFACIDVGNMHLDRGNPVSFDGIVKSDAGVGECPGIEYTTGEPLIGGLFNAVNQSPLMVGLKTLDGHAELGSSGFQHGFDVAEAGFAVDFGFPFSESSEVGPVQDQDALRLHDTIMQFLRGRINPNVS